MVLFHQGTLSFSPTAAPACARVQQWNRSGEQRRFTEISIRQRRATQPHLEAPQENSISLALPEFVLAAFQHHGLLQLCLQVATSCSKLPTDVLFSVSDVFFPRLKTIYLKSKPAKDSFGWQGFLFVCLLQLYGNKRGNTHMGINVWRKRRRAKTRSRLRAKEPFGSNCEPDIWSVHFAGLCDRAGQSAWLGLSAH